MLQTELGHIGTVMAAFERKRPDVAAHCRRVSDYAVRLATQIGLSAHDVETVRLGGLLHDVGKLNVSTRILSKPGRPTAREWQELKIHPELGVEIAHRSGFDDEVSSIVLYHHERWDGQGYPDGLSERAIFYLARIVNVTDTFDALTSAREYRERLTPEAARVLIARGAGTRFCPWVAAAFLAMPVDVLLPPLGQVPTAGHGADGRAALALETLTAPWHVSAEAAVSPCPC
jgi:putative nucleotidyltransferase with HDIG domain